MVCPHSGAAKFVLDPHAARFSIVAVSSLLATTAYAAPQYQTDDPEPVACTGRRSTSRAQQTLTSAERGGTLQGVVIHHGGAPNLQLHFRLPLAVARPGFGEPYRWVTRRYLRKLIRDHGAAGLA